jgi:exonuclease III
MNQGKLEVIKPEMIKVNVNILGISELKGTGMGEFNSDDHYIYYCEREYLRRNGGASMVNKRVLHAVLRCNLKDERMIPVRFQGKPFNITVIQAFAPMRNAEEAEVEWYCEDLQDLLELISKKDVLFIKGDWNVKVGSQEILGVTGKFGLGILNEAGQRLIEFFQENTLVIANTLFQQHKRRWSTPKSPKSD